MKHVFADTFYWVAIINLADQWRDRALDLNQELGDAHVVTSDEVLTETLNYFSEMGPRIRSRAVRDVRAILLNVQIEIVSCSHEAFLDAIALYEKRADKGYSLTDCISMNICRGKGISDVLTHDNHFVQEGFRILL